MTNMQKDNGQNSNKQIRQCDKYIIAAEWQFNNSNMTNKNPNIRAYICTYMCIYIYTILEISLYTLYISSENDWNSPLLDCISRWWFIHLCQCTLSHSWAAQLFWFQLESNWINMTENSATYKTLWSSSLPGCALGILRPCQISVSIESRDCSPKKARFKNV